jgi:hypothetical protein
MDMNNKPQTISEEQIKELSGVVSSLSQEVRKQVEGARKSLNTVLIIKAVLLGVILIYLSWAYTQFSKLDAETLVCAAEQKINNNEEEWVRNLKQSAPQFFTELENKSYEVIPAWRLQLEQELNKIINQMGDQFEAKMDVQLSAYIAQHKATIDKKFPKMSSKEKSQRLMEMIRSDFKTLSFKLCDETAKQLSKDVNKLTLDLEKLQRGYNLSEKEKAHRDLIAVWVKFMKMKAKKGQGLFQ